jgi:hypothetical protein
VVELPQNWPPWLVIACAVAAVGILIWILAKAVKWLLWLVLAVAVVACVIAAVRVLLK